ncbi:MAG: hypothetical protein QMD76_05085 [Anaerosomatales bacterium]|nr:hypothetical protein [Anaerosomatales bacterium]MDI6843802.1 hypothetical protein [Anaerosomatales bacterium]
MSLEYLRVVGWPSKLLLKWHYLLAEEQPVLSMLLMHASVGAALSDVSSAMGPWSIVVALVISQILQGGIMLLVEIRRAYEQTILVVARAIDLALGSPEGSAQPLSDSAVSIGRVRGLSIPQLQDLSRAALLWRLGCVGRAQEPALFGSQEVSDVLRRSAELIEHIRFLEKSAEILKGAADFMSSEEADARPSSEASRILCMAIGSFLGEGGDGPS